MLGYSALWVPETTGRDSFVHLGYLGACTQRLSLATGIANISNRHPGATRQAALTLAEQTSGRFILGLGGSHPRIVEQVRGRDYSRPLARLRDYLDEMAESPHTAATSAAEPPLVLAALGPRMLELAASRAAGAHTYFGTTQHTVGARDKLQDEQWLCVEQKVVLAEQPEQARAVAARAVSWYASLDNYRRHFARLGFTDSEINRPDERLIEATVAWGDADTIRRRIQEHVDAGATHVCIQPLDPEGGPQPHLPTLEALAPLA